MVFLRKKTPKKKKGPQVAVSAFSFFFPKSMVVDFWFLPEREADKFLPLLLFLCYTYCSKNLKASCFILFSGNESEMDLLIHLYDFLL